MSLADTSSLAPALVADPASDEPPSPASRRFLELWSELADLRAAEQLLEWDLETHAPPAGRAARGELLSTLAGLAHRRLTSPAMRDALAACDAAAAPGSLLAAQVRAARLLFDRAVKVPESLVRELATAANEGLVAWHAARQDDDFAPFAPKLARLVELRRQEAAAIDPTGPAYDVLLHHFEPGATEAMLAPLFSGLRAELTPLVRAAAESGRAVDESAARGRFPLAGQRLLGQRAAAAIGFDFARGRLDLSAHPFCVGIDPSDVRLTWRYEEEDLRPGLYGILHEAGHGLYEQGLPARWRRTPIGGAVSLGIHESQSRLWENHVGRSRGFVRWLTREVADVFPDAAAIDPDRLWAALHTARPTLIRVEADEATYNLHVVVRFELERRLFSGQLEVPELPAAWDELYAELLGVRPRRAVDGVLQDIHWAQGMFGYFPTYTLGTMAAAQLFAAAERRLGDLEESFAAGEVGPLLDWLRREVHGHGGRYLASELVERATGRPLGPDDLLAYLRQTVAAAYELPAT